MLEVASTHFLADGRAWYSLYHTLLHRHPLLTTAAWKYCYKTHDSPTTNCTQMSLRLNKKTVRSRDPYDHIIGLACPIYFPQYVTSNHCQTSSQFFGGVPLCPNQNFYLTAQGTSSSGPAGQWPESYNINDHLDFQIADRAHDVLDWNSPNVDEEAYLTHVCG
jgi:hypothetical protein